MEPEPVIQPAPAPLETLSAEDFETASIRSAAPSYISEAPSYHSTLPSSEETIPAYSPPAANSSTPTTVPATAATSEPSASAPNTQRRANSEPTIGLPPVPSGPLRRRSDLPVIDEFRIPSWSTINANPTARHYHSVAHRRVTEATSANATADGLKKLMLPRPSDGDDGGKLRPLEDPYLVGEEAARRARAQRLARENGDEILIRENQRWDWLLAQMRDWDERDRSWSQFRREMENGRRGRLARRIRPLR